ncbi:MAG: hypothetical protein JWM36_3229 [Hyphomicrobiales bacterium]|nr:hypothetical protein [Hyphomicrobiales bacterium]
MKIHAFKVDQLGALDMRQVLERIAALPLDKRLRTISGVDLRLEDLLVAGDYALADFATIRHEGPGRASVSNPIEDFELEDTEGFGHETALLYSKTSRAILQYNHSGPRVARIQTYLSGFCRDFIEGDGADGEVSGYGFSAVLSTDAAARLMHMSLVKKLEVSMYVPGVVANGALKDASLNSFLSNPLVGSAEKFSFSISAQRGKTSTLNLSQAKSFISDLLGIKEDVFSLCITAREDEDAPSEPIDLLRARLEADIPVQKTGRRFGRKERFAALRQAFEAWQANQQLG